MLLELAIQVAHFNDSRKAKREAQAEAALSDDEASTIEAPTALSTPASIASPHATSYDEST